MGTRSGRIEAPGASGRAGAPGGPRFLTRLFCYGTLERPRTLRAVAGRCFARRPAVLAGYVRLWVEGETFPGIAPRPAAVVPGTLYRGVGGGALRRIDHYESDYYRRCRVRVCDARGKLVTAWAYVVAEVHRDRLTAAGRYGPGIAQSSPRRRRPWQRAWRAHVRRGRYAIN